MFPAASAMRCSRREERARETAMAAVTESGRGGCGDRPPTQANIGTNSAFHGRPNAGPSKDGERGTE